MMYVPSFIAPVLVILKATRPGTTYFSAYSPSPRVIEGNLILRMLFSVGCRCLVALANRHRRRASRTIPTSFRSRCTLHQEKKAAEARVSFQSWERFRSAPLIHCLYLQQAYGIPMSGFCVERTRSNSIQPAGYCMQYIFCSQEQEGAPSTLVVARYVAPHL